jgi:GNAT superfamily N-acetyltransferase
LIQPSSGILSFPKSHFQSHFHSPQGRVLLAFSASSTPSSNTPIAFLTYSLLIASAPNILSSRPTSSACTPPLLVLETVGVAPQFQRNGIARALIEKAVEEAKTLAGRREGEGGQRRIRVRVWMREGGEEERVLEGLIGKEEGGVGGMGGKVKKEGKNGWWSGVI